MYRYYVNNKPQSNGDYEVHRQDCSYLPSDKTDLGLFDNCHGAVMAAKRYYPTANGCKFCSRPCHTT